MCVWYTLMFKIPALDFDINGVFSIRFPLPYRIVQLSLKSIRFLHVSEIVLISCDCIRKHLTLFDLSLLSSDHEQSIDCKHDSQNIYSSLFSSVGKVFVQIKTNNFITFFQLEYACCKVTHRYTYLDVLLSWEKNIQVNEKQNNTLFWSKSVFWIVIDVVLSWFFIDKHDFLHIRLLAFQKFKDMWSNKVRYFSLIIDSNRMHDDWKEKP